MKPRICDFRLGLRNSTTRLPFRYGAACLTSCPQAVVGVCVEFDEVARWGYSGDCLPPLWFDKRPDRDFPQQIDDMLSAIEAAEQVYRQCFAGQQSFFAAWLTAQGELQRVAAGRAWPGLLASFGGSLLERAVLDAIGRQCRLSFAELVRGDLLELEPAAVDPLLRGSMPRDWLPAKPSSRVFVRHTVGLADPLTAAEIAAPDRLEDGEPQALAEYLQRDGIRYLKIKLRNELDQDLDRLREVAALIESRRGADYGVTLDGNEQYRDLPALEALIDAVRGDARLAVLWQNTLAIEQPLARDIALHTQLPDGLGSWACDKPVIIDESDESLASYATALAVGYRGVSSKGCKGAIKSLLNAGRTWRMNQTAAARGDRANYIMTGEDLCCVGIIPVQSDLCLVATLGLLHGERNGHHYHPGLAYLPVEQQQAALAAHPDFYQLRGGVVRPAVRDGAFQLDSLQCPGMGFAVEPDLEKLPSAADWRRGRLSPQ